jgi:RimJ/RimL family protein N-acetyltransferase
LIHLREITVDDLPIFTKWRNDPDLISCLESPFRYINPETDRKWFDQYMCNRVINVRCAICHYNEPSQIIGSIGLLNIDNISKKADFYLMIGEKENRGKGVGTAATKQMLHHAFSNMNLNRVQLTVLETNTNALHVYEKVGFVKEGVQREAVYKNGNYINLIIMSILKNEFRE